MPKTDSPVATTPSEKLAGPALAKLFKLRLSTTAWDQLVALSSANRRSVNSEILTAIDAYVRSSPPRK